MGAVGADNGTRTHTFWLEARRLSLLAYPLRVFESISIPCILEKRKGLEPSFFGFAIRRDNQFRHLFIFCWSRRRGSNPLSMESQSTCAPVCNSSALNKKRPLQINERSCNCILFKHTYSTTVGALSTMFVDLAVFWAYV